LRIGVQVLGQSLEEQPADKGHGERLIEEQLTHSFGISRALLRPA